MSEILIRAYTAADRESVRRIAWETAFLGEPAVKFFHDRELLSDFLTRYFTDYEPESSLVAETGGQVIGYLNGAKDVEKSFKIFARRILPRLIGKAIRRGTFLRAKDLKFLLNLSGSFFKGELKTPDYSRSYPATLHLNIDSGQRAAGTGRKLIEQYLNYLRENKVAGVHFGTISEKAAGFFRKLGFELLFQNYRSYHYDILRQKVNYYIFGKKLL